MEYGESRKQVEYKLSPDSVHDPHISETLRKTKKKKLYDSGFWKFLTQCAQSPG